MAKSIEELEEKVKELTHQLLVLGNPDEARFFVCKNGHTHFLFDCSGCQHEFDEVLANIRLAGRNETIEELEKWMIVHHSTGMFEVVLKEKLVAMKKEDGHEAL